jgi:hypothetical protein
MTHSLLYTIDPFTESGAIGTLKVTKHWIVQLGISASHDVAIWSDDRRQKARGLQKRLDFSTALWRMVYAKSWRALSM